MSVSEGTGGGRREAEGGRRRRRRRRKADTELKTKTPHVNVGNKKHIFTFLVCFVLHAGSLEYFYMLLCKTSAYQ